MKEGKLIVISGPSGVGKGTLCRELVAQKPEIAISVSTTTRAPRVFEREGREYFFVSKESFVSMAKRNLFLEWARYNDDFYGTSKNFVENVLMGGKDVLLEIDVQGALNVKAIYSGGLYIFVAPPSMEILRSRLLGRLSESDDQVQKRLERAENELTAAKGYDHVIVNDDLQRAVGEIVKLIDTRN